MLPTPRVFTMLPFRQSPFSGYEISLLCCRTRLTPFSTILWFWSVLSISWKYIREIFPPKHLQIYLHVCRGVRYPRPPAIASSNPAVVLIHNLFTPVRLVEIREVHIPLALCRYIYTTTSFLAYFSLLFVICSLLIDISALDMLHSPSGFPFG